MSPMEELSAEKPVLQLLYTHLLLLFLKFFWIISLNDIQNILPFLKQHIKIHPINKTCIYCSPCWMFLRWSSHEKRKDPPPLKKSNEFSKPVHQFKSYIIYINKIHWIQITSFHPNSRKKLCNLCIFLHYFQFRKVIEWEILYNSRIFFTMFPEVIFVVSSFAIFLKIFISHFSFTCWKSLHKLFSIEINYLEHQY